METLKSRYAIISDVGTLYGSSNFLTRGMSSVSRMGGRDLGSRSGAASWREGGRGRERGGLEGESEMGRGGGMGGREGEEVAGEREGISPLT